MNLTGVNVFYNQTNPFTLTPGVGPLAGWQNQSGYQAGKPAGLLDGVTNYHAPDTCNTTNNPLVAVPNTCGGGVDHWQGAIFAGLTPGT